MILPLLVFCSRFHRCVSIYPINKRFKSLEYWEWHLFQNAEQIGHKGTDYKSGIEKGPLWTSFWVSVSKYGLFFLGIFYVEVCCYQNNVVNKFETLFKITLSYPWLWFCSKLYTPFCFLNFKVQCWFVLCVIYFLLPFIVSKRFHFIDFFQMNCIFFPTGLAYYFLLA